MTIKIKEGKNFLSDYALKISNDETTIDEINFCSHVVSAVPLVQIMQDLIVPMTFGEGTCCR